MRDQRRRVVDAWLGGWLLAWATHRAILHDWPTAALFGAAGLIYTLPRRIA